MGQVHGESGVFQWVFVFAFWHLCYYPHAFQDSVSAVHVFSSFLRLPFCLAKPEYSCASRRCIRHSCQKLCSFTFFVTTATHREVQCKVKSCTILNSVAAWCVSYCGVCAKFPFWNSLHSSRQFLMDSEDRAGASCQLSLLDQQNVFHNLVDCQGVFRIICQPCS